ncbi:MAG TPA: VCBS repeat-containing protein [Candidatus Binatia bacterium]|nr:VCBS repeat-containing protein [Candidatus Binatia bacterium]
MAGVRGVRRNARQAPATIAAALACALVACALAACTGGRDGADKGGTPSPTATSTQRIASPADARPAAPAAPPPGGAAGAPSSGAAAAPRRDPIAGGGPYPALFVVQAQFTDKVMPDGKRQPVPGAAKLMILRFAPGGTETAILEDPGSNVFHKALPWDGGVLTIGATRALLKTWKFGDGRWTEETRWSPTFGGKFDRLRDVEVADVDGDGKQDLVIATHDQGVIAIVHPSDGWRVEEIDRQPNTFVHEIEIGDVDGDGQPEIFATPSEPNKLDKEQPGEVRMYKRTPGKGWLRSVVDAPGDTHAKEILAADVDRDGKAELYVVWEGAIGAGGDVARPVTIKQYRMKDGAWQSAVVATVPDRQMRSLVAGDANGDGKIDLVAGGLSSGIWLFEQQDGGTWKSTQIEAQSSGFEHPVLLADLDGDGKPEIYVASEDQHELRRYRFRDGKFQKEVIAPLAHGDITWNLTAGKL